MEVKSKKSKRSEKDVVSDKSKKKRKSTAMTVNFTGIRDGETIVGNNPNQTKGVEMLVKGATYYPIDCASDEMLRDQFKSVAFFSTMSFKERQEWMTENLKKYQAPSKENHLYDPVNDGLKVKFIKIECKHFMEKLEPSVIEMLLKGNEEDEEGYWPIREVYELFKPKNKVTNANRHNLTLRPDNWELKRIAPKCSIFNGPIVLRLKEAGLEKEYNAEKKNIAVLGEETLISFTSGAKQEIGIIYQASSVITKESLFSLSDDYLTNEEAAECSEIATLIGPFSPSLYKSLMQKIVRTQCSFVVHDNREYSSRAFLLVTFILLSVHKGSFNPNKQRFVTGLESATKRLAIIVCEDSYVKDMNDISLLLVDALIKQQDRSWMPPLDHFAVFFKIALEALDSPSLLIYKTDKEHNIAALSWLDKKGIAPYKLNAVLLKEIGSMSGDINFFSHLALSPVLMPENKRKEVIRMPLISCIDQHCFTSIGHFLPYDEVYIFSLFPSPFSMLIVFRM